MKKMLLFALLAFFSFVIAGCAAKEASDTALEEALPAEKLEMPVPAEEAENTQNAKENQQEETKEAEKPATDKALQKEKILVFSKKIKIADAVFPGIFFANENFYATYNKNNDVYIKKFDSNFNEIQEKKLTNANKVNDIQAAYDNGFFYVVYSTPGKSGKPDKGLYLKKFDLNFNEIKSIAITEEAPKTEATNDMFLSLINGLLHVGTFYIPPPRETPNFGHNIRVYDTDLNLKKEFVANERAHQNGASLVFSDNKFSIISGANVNLDQPNRDLIALSYGEDWNFLNDRVISAEPEDEYWPMGAFFDGNTFYVAYTSMERFNGQFCQNCDMGAIYLKRYGKDFNFMGKTKVSDESPSHRAHVLKVNNKIYVAYDSFENNNFKVYVKEFLEE